jgi:hypothetical protein
MTNPALTHAMTINTGLGGVAQFIIPFSLSLPIMAIKYMYGSDVMNRSVLKLFRLKK